MKNSDVRSEFFVELAGTEPISYTAKYQLFNFSKLHKLPNYHLKNVLF